MTPILHPRIQKAKIRVDEKKGIEKSSGYSGQAHSIALYIFTSLHPAQKFESIIVTRKSLYFVKNVWIKLGVDSAGQYRISYTDCGTGVEAVMSLELLVLC